MPRLSQLFLWLEAFEGTTSPVQDFTMVTVAIYGAVNGVREEIASVAALRTYLKQVQLISTHVAPLRLRKYL